MQRSAWCHPGLNGRPPSSPTILSARCTSAPGSRHSGAYRVPGRWDCRWAQQLPPPLQFFWRNRGQTRSKGSARLVFANPTIGFVRPNAGVLEPWLRACSYRCGGGTPGWRAPAVGVPAEDSASDSGVSATTPSARNPGPPRSSLERERRETSASSERSGGQQRGEGQRAHNGRLPEDAHGPPLVRSRTSSRCCLAASESRQQEKKKRPAAARSSFGPVLQAPTSAAACPASGRCHSTDRTAGPRRAPWPGRQARTSAAASQASPTPRLRISSDPRRHHHVHPFCLHHAGHAFLVLKVFVCQGEASHMSWRGNTTNTTQRPALRSCSGRNAPPYGPAASEN